jgi:S1/P1 Nuclease
MAPRIATALLLVSFLSTNAFAWGGSGHKITARLAQEKLSNETEREVREILGTRWMADVASLPDDWRKNDGAQITAGWHFVNTRIEDETYDQQRDCPGDQCVVEQLRDMRDTLANRDSSASARREALIYIIHFVGDIHQPFHCGSGTVDGQPDRGGNNIKVKFGGMDSNLHAVWDSGLISRRGLNVAQYVEHLEDEVVPDLDASIAGGTPADWANESHQIAQDKRVQNNSTITNSYIEDALPVVDQRLARGALRLAKLIEDALGGN